MPVTPLAQFPAGRSGDPLMFQASPFPGGSNPGAITSKAIPIGAWTFVVLTYDDSTDGWSFYVDGSPDAAGPFDFQIQDTPRDLLIGVSEPVGPGAGFFPGVLDDIRIYKRALSASDVADLFSLSPPFDFTGFFPPVDILDSADPELNSVKAGASVPVKFSLDGDQGLGIFAPGYPKSESIVCDSSAEVEGIESTATAGSSSLSYDATSDQYTYVWKTLKGWIDSCRQLVVKLSDGATYRANFSFR